MRYKAYLIQLVKKIAICSFVVQFALIALPFTAYYLTDTRNVELNRYVEDFEEEYGVYVNYPVGIGEIPESTSAVGACYSYGPGRSVVISERYWDRATARDKKATVYHELGHCSLDKDHEEGDLEDGCPQSLMNPYTITEYCMEKHWKYYVEQLRS